MDAADQRLYDAIVAVFKRANGGTDPAIARLTERLRRPAVGGAPSARASRRVHRDDDDIEAFLARL